MNISSNRLCHQTEHTYIIVHWVALISHVREARREIFTTPGLVTARRSILGPPAEGRPGHSHLKMSPAVQLVVTLLTMRMRITFLITPHERVTKLVQKFTQEF